MNSNRTSSSLSPDIDTRIHQAQELWARGALAEASGDYAQAYTLYTSAHDLIIDCALLHEQAHQRLRRVNLRLGNYGELLTDWTLALFAPLGVFSWVAWSARRAGGWFHSACKRV